MQHYGELKGALGQIIKSIGNHSLSNSTSGLRQATPSLPRRFGRRWQSSASEARPSCEANGGRASDKPHEPVPFPPNPKDVGPLVKTYPSNHPLRESTPKPVFRKHSVPVQPTVREVRASNVRPRYVGASANSVRHGRYVVLERHRARNVNQAGLKETGRMAVQNPDRKEIVTRRACLDYNVRSAPHENEDLGFESTKSTLNRNPASPAMDEQISPKPTRKNLKSSPHITDFCPTLKMLGDATVANGLAEDVVQPQKRDSEQLLDEASFDEVDLEQLENILDDITDTASHAHLQSRSMVRAANIKQHVQAKLLSRPAGWTRLNLPAYVESLIEVGHQAKPNQADLLNHGALNETTRHLRIVHHELLSIFTDENAIPFITHSTLDRCLAFFIRHRKFHAIQRTFLSLRDAAYSFSSSNFHALLYAASKDATALNFQQILGNMLQSGLQPTTKTWYHFYAWVCHVYPRHIRHVIYSMRRRSLIADPDILRQVMIYEVNKKLAAFLDDGSTAEEFLDKLELRYRDRSQWFSTAVANRMCSILLKKEKFHDALKILSHLRDRGHPKDRKDLQISTVHTFLLAASQKQDLEAAIAYLKALIPSSQPDRDQVHDLDTLQLDSFSFRLLFLLAWDQRYFNIVRVVWRYACTTGNASAQMQTRVLEGLRTHRDITCLQDREETQLGNRDYGITWLEKMSRSAAWRFWASRFAVGVRESPAHPYYAANTHDPVSPYDERAITFSRSQCQTRNGDQVPTHDSKQLTAIFNQDIAAFEPVRATRHFVDSLELAWQRDREWKEGRLPIRTAWGEAKLFEEMLRHGVDVHVEALGDGDRAF